MLGLILRRSHRRRFALSPQSNSKISPIDTDACFFFFVESHGVTLAQRSAAYLTGLRRRGLHPARGGVYLGKYFMRAPTHASQYGICTKQTGAVALSVSPRRASWCLTHSSPSYTDVCLSLKEEFPHTITGVFLVLFLPPFTSDGIVPIRGSVLLTQGTYYIP